MTNNETLIELKTRFNIGNNEGEKLKEVLLSNNFEDDLILEILLELQQYDWYEDNTDLVPYRDRILEKYFTVYNHEGKSIRPGSVVSISKINSDNTDSLFYGADYVLRVRPEVNCIWLDDEDRNQIFPPDEFFVLEGETLKRFMQAYPLNPKQPGFEDI